MKKLQIALISLLILSKIGYTAKAVDITKASPSEIVQLAYEYMSVLDYTNLLTLTMSTEAEKTKDNLHRFETDESYKAFLKKEATNVKSFEITSEELFGEIQGMEVALVETKWVIDIEHRETPSNVKIIEEGQKTEVLYTEIMLKKTDNGWKIASQKTK